MAEDLGFLGMLRWLESVWIPNYLLVWFAAPLMVFKSKDNQANFLETKLFLRRLTILAAIAPVVVSLFMLLVVAFLKDVSPAALLKGWMPRHLLLALYCSPMLAVGIGARFAWARFVVPRISAVQRQHLKGQKTDKLTDIRTESERYMTKDFEPEAYYTDDALFFGLDENDQPITIPWQLFYENCLQVIGPAQKGKGVIFQVLISQQIKKGDFVCYLDPKHDKFIPQLMYHYAQKYGRRFVILDLSDEGPGFWHLFVEGTKDQQEERLIAGLNLGDSGDSKSNHYRQEDLAALLGSNPPSHRIDDMLSALEANPKNKERAVYRELGMWARIRSLSYGDPADAISIKQALLDNAVIYVKSSLSNERVLKATQSFMHTVRLMASSLSTSRTAHATMYIDEVSFLVSEELRTGPAAALSTRLNYCLAYQSYLDLLNTPDKTVDAKSISASLNNNCQIKAIYGTNDPETKKWVSLMSGTRVKKITSQERTKVNAAGGEAWDQGRTVTEKEVPFLEQNTIASFNKRVCAFFLPGGKPPQILHTCFVKSDREPYDKHLAVLTQEHLQKLQAIESRMKAQAEEATPQKVDSPF
jgi:hypothetical protein